MTLNDEYWKEIFKKYDILKEIDEKGIYEISASEIKEFREPRLMVKFDYKNQLPEIFSENNLSILPITKGKYIISRFKAYHKLEKRENEIRSFEFPEHIESLDFNNITSEAQAINCAYITGIIQDFLEEDEGIYPTVQGRMGSGEFNFNIVDTDTSNRINVNIKNSQIEIDGAYEGLNFLSLIEAKIEYPENFLVRQLYYPFRTWNNCIDKEVKTIFLIYSNGIFSLYEYSFEDEDCYNSLKLTKQESYSIIDGEIEMEDLESIVSSIEIISEPKIPFPQADSFERVISLCESLKEKKLNRNEITEKYSFDMRQSNYYASAGMYLGLIDKTQVNGRVPCYSLTKRGNKIFTLPLKQRQLELVKFILEHEVFLNTFKLWLKRGEVPSLEERLDIMKKSNLYHVTSDETYKRRSRTILRWLEWILDLKNV